MVHTKLRNRLGNERVMKLVRVYAHLRSNNQENSDNFDAIQESEEPWSGKEQMLSKSCHQKLHITHPGLYMQSIINFISYYNLIFIYDVLIVSFSILLLSKKYKNRQNVNVSSA